MSQDTKKVLITGGSGLIGNHLQQLCKAAGIPVRLLVREKSALRLKAQGKDAFFWDVEKGLVEAGAFDSVGTIIHLAGENIGTSRWTVARKKAIIDSRIQAAETLSHALEITKTNVEAIVCASAIGFYGNVPSGIVDENSTVGSGFQSEVTQIWEKALFPLKSYASHFYVTRIGIVLDKEQGALPEMLLPARLGVSALGDGQQMMSWIHIDDVCRAMMFLAEEKPLSGTYNLVAEQPVTNQVFMQTLSKALGSISLPINAPSFAMRLVLGEMAQLVLGGAAVSNQKLLSAGFQFKYPSLPAALQTILQHKGKKH